MQANKSLSVFGLFSLRSCAIVVVVLTSFLSACASGSPNFGDSVASEGDQFSAISDKWADGQKLVSKGQKKIKKGQREISDGNENISEGEAMVRRGQRLMSESEEEYKLKKEF